MKTIIYSLILFLICFQSIICSEKLLKSSLPVLFTPFKINGLTFRNRICVSPMDMYTSEDGFANDFHLGHYLSFATGGAGLVMIEGTGVSNHGRITPADNGLYKDSHIEPLAKIVKQIKKYGSVAGIQLLHSGRKGSTKILWEGGESIDDNDGGWPTVAPSAIPYDDKKITKVPKEATIEDMEEIKKQFAEAAQRAVKAGFQVIMIQFGHGYILHQFLSSITNKRSDEYGGDLKNRMKFPLEVAESVANVVSNETVLIGRITVTDHVTNGWDVHSNIELAKELKKLGFDWIDCSGYSGLIPWDPTIKSNPYTVQIDASKQIHKEVGVTTSLVGGIFKAKYAEEIVANNTASLVMLGRAFLDNPHWPYRAADELGVLKEDLFPIHYSYVIANEKFRKLVKNEISKTQ